MSRLTTSLRRSRAWYAAPTALLGFCRRRGWHGELGPEFLQALPNLESWSVSLWVWPSPRLLASLLARASRRHEFVERQIRELYAPLAGLRRDIRIKSELRQRISEAAHAVSTQLSSGLSVESSLEFSKSRGPEFENIIKYDNKQLNEELLPDYRRMIEVFKTHGWLAEESTLKDYPMLVEFVELWKRSEDGALPWEVTERIGHHQSKLAPLYDDIEEHLGRLRGLLASGKM